MTRLMYAKNVGKKIVPIILDNSKLSGWFLFEFGSVDYVDINDAMHKQKFHENLKSWLGLDNNGQGPQDLFDVGLHYYLKQDYKVAVEWFMKAAAFEYAEAQYYLGVCYNEGQGVALDFSKAMEWYMKAERQGHAESQKKIGILYKYGWGVSRDDAKALEWYIRGEGIEQDYKEAVKWFEKAAAKGTPGAQFYLGYCYYNGLGVQQDYGKAIHWFKQATKKNHAASEFHLGLCYLDGKGVQRDAAEARVCFRKALKQGYEEAKKYL